MITISLATSNAVCGSTLQGKVSYSFSQPEPFNVRLIYFTAGKGSEDVCLVEERVLEVRSPSGESPFEVQLPDSPWSFSGTLITLTWAIEIITASGREHAREHFIVSPTGSEVVLSSEPKRSILDGFVKLGAQFNAPRR